MMSYKRKACPVMYGVSVFKKTIPWCYSRKKSQGAVWFATPCFKVLTKNGGLGNSILIGYAKKLIFLFYPISDKNFHTFLPQTKEINICPLFQTYILIGYPIKMV